MRIQRLLFRARPNRDHPRYFQWQTAKVCVFVADDNQQSATDKAVAKLHDERWTMIEFEGGSVLIEDRVRQQGGEVWDAYRVAQKKGISFLAIVEGITGTKQNPMMPLVPRITEKFIDTVVERAGGRRLTAEECNNECTRNADYLLDNDVLELKILEEEGFEKPERQAKLAAQFERPIGPLGTIELDPSKLSEEGRRRYLDIVGGPIQNAVKSASKQIRSTKAHLKRDDLRGVALFVNTGYGALHPDLLYPLLKRYAAKDTTQVKEVAAISNWLVPGELFDGTLYFQFEPKESTDTTLAKLRKAFWQHVDEFMTAFMHAGMPQEGDMIDPLKTIAFEKQGIVFTAVPHRD